jgi:hypothetical protein
MIQTEFLERMMIPRASPEDIGKVPHLPDPRSAIRRKEDPFARYAPEYQHLIKECRKRRINRNMTDENCSSLCLKFKPLRRIGQYLLVGLGIVVADTNRENPNTITSTGRTRSCPVAPLRRRRCWRAGDGVEGGLQELHGPGGYLWVSPRGPGKQGARLEER